MSLANRVAKFLYRNEPQSIEDKCLKILSLCRKTESLKQCLCVHSPVVKLGLYENMYLCNNLLFLYAKCNGPEIAGHFFDEMPQRDVVSWTGLVTAYTRDGKHYEAVEVFDSMIVSGEIPNQFTFSSIMRSCCSISEFDEGSRVHAYVIKLGFGSNTFLMSSLMHFYAKCGFFEAGQEVFRDMDGGGDTVSWTTMISSLVEARKWGEVLRRYIEMIGNRVPANEFTFAKLLAASCHLDPHFGRLLHAHLTVMGIRMSLVLKTALVNMYSRFRRTEDAIKVMHRTPEHDVSLWTSLVSGLSDNLQLKEAVSALTQMEIIGVSPNSFTYSSLLKGCSNISSLELGKQVHSAVIRTGSIADVCVGNALVDMYMTCSNSVDDSLRTFDEIAYPNVISWTSLITGLAKHGFEQDSFVAFSEMQAEGIEPNSFTISAVLSSCGVIKSRTQTLKLHGYIIKANAEYDMAVCNALVDAYAAVGMVDDSGRFLMMMSRRDAITYTSLVTRLNESGHHEMALSIIKSLSEDGVEMDGFSLASFLSASSALVTMETGKQLHSYAVKSGFRNFSSVASGLVDLYWKCGDTSGGYRAFSEVSKPDVVLWNGLISGLASNGYISKALSAFDDMRLAGHKPDSVTFLSLLFACSRGGLVDMGLEYFHSMRSNYSIMPQLDHYICLIDLLGRAGQLENAMDVITSMPFEPDPLIYKTLLSSCIMHRNVLLGEDMARRGMKLDPFDSALYSLLAKLYHNCDRSDLAEKTRQLMKDKGLRKNLGRSRVEIRNEVHVFNAGDRSHPRINDINDKIKSLITELRKQGYNFEVTEGSAYHSEKLAVAFGLLSMPSNATLRICKNMRICSECHDFIVLVTRLVDRDIILRDGNRTHNFRSGECSCRGC